VIFDAAGGSPAAQVKVVNSGASVGTEMPEDPVKSGFIFGGWYTEQNGGGSAFTDTTTVSEHTTVYARWVIRQYTVTFNADGGSPDNQTRTVAEGASIGAGNMPVEPVKNNHIFEGWYTEQNGGGTAFTGTTTVSGNITVYARWTNSVPASSLQEALTWLNTNAAEGGAYTITLNADESIGPNTLSYGNKQIHITIKGGAAERIVSLSSNGSLFTLGNGVTLTLDNNITLRGKSINTDSSLVQVNSGAALVMHTGAKIRNNGIYPGGNYVSTKGGGIVAYSALGGITADGSARHGKCAGVYIHPAAQSFRG
jgi:uncharacterized repeat protein (TIGR02543 family)